MKRFIRKFIQITYIIIFIITSAMVLHALQNDYKVSTIVSIMYHISAFLAVGKCFYCWATDYIKQAERN